MKKIKNDKIVLGIMMVLVIGLFAFGTGAMSIIDDEDNGVVCQMTIGGGESEGCNLLLKLPEGKELASGYSFDLNVESIPDENFSTPQEITHFTKSSYQEISANTYANKEDIDVFLYRQPSEWSDIYSVNLSASSTVSGRTSGDGRIYKRLSAGYINKPYPYGEVIVCQSGSYEDCHEDAIVKNYYQTDGDLYYSSTRLTTTGYAPRFYAKESYGTVTETLLAQGIKSKPVKDSPTLFVETSTEWRYVSPSTNTYPQPKLMVSYKKEHFIKDLKIMIGSTILKIYPGITKKH